jgi:hypothetical protein
MTPPPSWELLTEAPDERTERLRVDGGWLYRTAVFVSQPDGEKTRYVGATVALAFVPEQLAARIATWYRRRGREIGPAPQ